MSSIEGLDELNRKLAGLKGLKDDKQALLAGALRLQRYSQINAPVDTGFLRASATSYETEDGAEVAFQANYAYYVEFGTSKMPAQPYVRPAIEEHSDDIVRKVAEVLQKHIDDIAGG